MSCKKALRRGRGHEPFARGSTLSEYLVVLAALSVVWLGIEVLLGLIRQHSDNYASVLELML